MWRVTAVPICWEQRPKAVVLWGGAGTVASHLTSAYLLDLLPRRAGPIEITSDHSLAPRPGIKIHRCALGAAEVVQVRGIPCTSVSRTLVDLCHTETIETAEKALDAALRTEKVTHTQLCEFVERAAARSVRGSATLRPLLAVRGDDEAMSESDAESAFARVIRKGGLPLGQRQAPREGVRNGRIDFFYPEHNLFIEIDSRKWHSARREKKRDKRYDNEINISGRRVLRLTWEDLEHDEEYVLDVVGRALGQPLL